MKILVLGRADLFKTYGGDRVQIENTVNALQRLNVSCDVLTDLPKDLTTYDIVHVFQLDWNPACEKQILGAKKAGLPVVFSPIHHSIQEVKRFDDEYIFDFRRISKFLFSDQFKRDVFKDIYRAAFDIRKLPMAIYEITKGLKKIYISALKHSDIVLVQTIKEAKDLIATFGVNVNWVKVCNGVGVQFTNTINYLNPFEFKDYVVCTGRIEARKNQLRIIEAVNKLRNELGKDVHLVLIGAKSANKHPEYTYLFNKLLSKYKWVHHLAFVPYDQMPAVYKYAKVGVSASWFETTGLTSLEALMCGSNAVASGVRAKEYLGEYVSYCDPGNDSSIFTALRREYLAPRPVLLEQFKNEYTWSTTAHKTKEVYLNLTQNYKKIL